MNSQPSSPGRVGLPAAYVAGSIILIALVPFLTRAEIKGAFLVASLGALVAVAYGVTHINRRRRRAWQYLLAALILVNVANVVRLFGTPPAIAISSVLDAAGNTLVLAGALALVIRQGRRDLGTIIDTTIVALALGGLLWDSVLLPHLQGDYASGALKLNVLVVVFVLCGVLGALIRLAQMTPRPVAALWTLIAALLLALAGNIVQAVTTDHRLAIVSTMMFMGAYTAVGLFGLDRDAGWLARAKPVPLAEEALSVGRLAFLGVAVAIMPVVVGVREIAGADVDGLLLVVGGIAISVLVMMRIGLLSRERARAERALRYEATHDPLTGLPNRREFVARLGDELLLATRCVILFCDLDGFKAVNDRLGHGAGDQVLVEIGRRLRACVRRDDLVSRFGGDEFLVLFRNTSYGEVKRVCDRIAEALARPVVVLEEPITVGASMGLVSTDRMTPATFDPEELIRRADHAMYAAKQDEPSSPGIRMVLA